MRRSLTRTLRSDPCKGDDVERALEGAVFFEVKWALEEAVFFEATLIDVVFFKVVLSEVVFLRSGVVRSGFS